MAAVIIGMAELAAPASVAADPKLSAMVKQIDEAAAQLVQRMLAFARKQPLERHIRDLNDAVKRAAGMLERTPGAYVARQCRRAMLSFEVC